ncbi:hypothetical protein BGW80DRAFT_1382963, partial [Lactifluus volemus]
MKPGDRRARSCKGRMPNGRTGLRSTVGSCSLGTKRPHLRSDCGSRCDRSKILGNAPHPIIALDYGLSTILAVPTNLTRFIPALETFGINKVALQFVTASKARTKGYAPSSSSSAILASLSPVSSIRLPLRRGASPLDFSMTRFN